MTSAYKMQLPFTTKQEILDLEALYLEDISEKRQRQEQAVIDIKNTVQTRRKSETPGGYLRQAELLKMAKWKSHYTPSKIDENSPERIKEVTREAFGLDDDWKKLKKLIGIYGGLYGIRESVASVILHLYDRGDYPILFWAVH